MSWKHNDNTDPSHKYFIMTSHQKPTNNKRRGMWQWKLRPSGIYMHTSGFPGLCYKTRPYPEPAEHIFSSATLIPLITAAIIYDNTALCTSRFIFFINNSNLKIISVNRLSLCRLGPVEGCGCCRQSKLKLAELCVHQCVTTPPSKKNKKKTAFLHI